MRIQMTLLTVLSGMMACAPSADNETQAALSAYTHFVDSVYQVNETWKTATDTDYVEYPIDPEDPTLTRLDTVVTLPEAKQKSIVFDSYWGKVLMEDYTRLKMAVDSKKAKMDEKMKIEYEEANAKYENLLNP